MGRSGKTEICLFCKEAFKPFYSTKKKYCSMRCSQDHERRLRFDRIQKDGKVSSNRSGRSYLLALYGNKCSCCLRKTWARRAIPLVLDHINGNPYDYRLENLRLLCPNCDALTNTYKGKNRGNGRHARRQRYKEGKSF